MSNEPITSSVAPNAPEPSLDKSTYLPQLDVLRACAALWVVCFHTLGWTFRNSLPGYQLPFHNQEMVRDLSPLSRDGLGFIFPLIFGWAGVALFFVLSGFVIHYAYLKTEEGAFSPLAFYWRRFWRIYPAYIVALGAFIFFPMPGGEVIHQGHIDVWQVASHLLFLHNLKWETFFAVNGSFWSLANEVQFYAIYPLVVFLRKRIGMTKMLWISIAISIIFRSAFISQGVQYEEGMSSGWYWRSVPVTWMDWMLGAYAAELFVKGKSFFPQGKFPVLPFSVLGLCIVTNQIRGFDSILSWSLIVLFFVWVVEKTVRCPLPNTIWHRKIIVPIGLCSYSLYLWHQPIIGHTVRTLYYRFGIHIPQDIGGWLMLVTLVLAVSLPIAFLSYYWIEVPGRKLGSLLWKRLHRVPSK